MQYSEYQLQALEAAFVSSKYPTRNERDVLEQVIRLPSEKIKVSFMKVKDICLGEYLILAG